MTGPAPRRRCRECGTEQPYHATDCSHHADHDIEYNGIGCTTTCTHPDHHTPLTP